MQKYIEVPLMGGLGNQLFQLSAGIDITNSTGRAVKFSTFMLDLPKVTKNTKWPIGITDLLDEDELLVRNRLNSLLKALKNHLHLGSGHLFEQSIVDDVLSKVLPSTRYVQGYFQNWEMVERTWPLLLHRLTNSSEFSPLTQGDVEQRIVVHARMGDYRTNPRARAFHGLTHPSYYVNAIHEAVIAGAAPKVLLVSDEPDSAYRNLSLAGLDSQIQLLISEPKSQFQDLDLISKSSHIVMSNSSFSWWGAWIGSKLFGSEVYIPSPWFASKNIVEPNLYKPKWNNIERVVCD